MIRLRTLVLAALAVGALAPSPARAQSSDASTESRPSTHTVRKGDTLWDLARQYLGNPRRWPELHQLNAALISDPHWIEPGMVLRLVSSVAPAAEAGASAPATPARDVASSSAASPPSAAAAPTPAPRAPVPPALAVAERRTTAIRVGDFRAAPYLDAVGGPTGQGVIESTVTASLAASTPSERAVQFRDRVRVRLPQGATGMVGEQLLVISLGDRLASDGQVVIPAGIVTLTRPATGGVAEGELTKLFQAVQLGQAVTLPDRLVMPEHVQPLAVAFGQVARVRWILGAHVLSSPGQYLILDATTADGLVPGDQLSLRNDPDTEVELGVVQVVRVSARGTTAIVLQVRHSGLAVGTRARVSAKMP